MANHLKRDKKLTIISLLCEGCSIRSIERITRFHRDTIMRLLVRTGEHCAAILDREIRGIYTSSFQCDEIWTFVGKKQRRLIPGDPGEFGDAYTFIAIDRESKLIVAHEIGKRDERTMDIFIRDLSERVESWVQIFTDGYGPYRAAIPRHFGTRANYSQVVKRFDGDDDEEHRYSPPTVRSVDHVWISGFPRRELISTSHIERLNWSIRTALRRYTRLSNGFSRKLDNLRAAFSLYAAYFNWCRKHATIKTTPAVAMGLAAEPWPIEQLIPN